MATREPNNSLPSEVVGVLATAFPLPILAVLSGVLLPIVVQLKAAGWLALYGAGLVSGVAGVILMFVSRLPMYRQGRFWTVGPRELDDRHRRLYWWSYVLVGTSAALLCFVWGWLPEIPLRDLMLESNPRLR